MANEMSQSIGTSLPTRPDIITETLNIVKYYANKCVLFLGSLFLGLGFLRIVLEEFLLDIGGHELVGRKFHCEGRATACD